MPVEMTFPPPHLVLSCRFLFGCLLDRKCFEGPALAAVVVAVGIVVAVRVVASPLGSLPPYSRAVEVASPHAGRLRSSHGASLRKHDGPR